MELSEFISHHAGNFRFTTSIDHNALTFSFQPSQPLPPIESYHISEPSTPSYSPLPLDNTPVDGRDIMDPSQPTTIPNIPAPPLFDENLNSLANGTLSTIPEGTELSEDRYNETLNTTFGEPLHDLIFSQNILNILANA
jgi:hypothetical protein